MELDYRSPDYGPIIKQRVERLQWMRAVPGRAEALLHYYRDHPADMICDWGWTYDPRNPEVGRPAEIPFILFPKQREWVTWLLERWRNRERGLTEKSRELGVSWLAVATACNLCVTHRGLLVGFGSNLERNVDKIGDPDSLLWKARFYLDNLPVEFRGGYSRSTSVLMQVRFHKTGSLLKGDAGANIGRGGRSSLYVVDEAAHLQHPADVEAALSQTTNCRIDVSSVSGMANPFAQRRFGGKTSVFTFHWRDDPRKGDDWYKSQLEKLDPVTVAQEVDMDYSAAVEGVLIPSAWVQSAIDAHIKLGIEPAGARRAGFDVADEGRDACAWAHSQGVLLKRLEEWSGRSDDIFSSVAQVAHWCDEEGVDVFDYDADGLGAGVRGDIRVLNESREHKLVARAFHGSGKIVRPEMAIPSAAPPDGRTADRIRRNRDFFYNRKAQEWWSLRVRFDRTHRAVQAGSLGGYSPDDLISLDSRLPLLAKLITEMSQPTYSISGAGKVIVNKSPDGTKSPNLADAVMICYSNPSAPGLRIGLH